MEEEDEAATETERRDVPSRRTASNEPEAAAEWIAAFMPS